MIGPGRQAGITLIEIMIALTITGVLAVLTLPRFLATQEDRSVVNEGKVEQIMQQLSMSVKAFETGTGQDFATSSASLEWAFFTYGGYFAYKQVSAGPPALKYFLLPDGSRVTVTPTLFSLGMASPLTEYRSAPPPVGALLWTHPDTPAVEGYCGTFSARECVYIDVTGRNGPNRAGKSGDLIPLRVNPETGEVKTLYQWELEDMPPPYTDSQRCNFVSSYDVQTQAVGASGC